LDLFCGAGVVLRLTCSTKLFWLEWRYENHSMSLLWKRDSVPASHQEMVFATMLYPASERISKKQDLSGVRNCVSDPDSASGCQQEILFLPMFQAGKQQAHQGMGGGSSRSRGCLPKAAAGKEPWRMEGKSTARATGSNSPFGRGLLC